MVGCTNKFIHDPYSSATANESAQFKHVVFPFASGVSLNVRQGAFGKSSHNELGNQYSWDFQVPFGTEVHSVENGVVIEVWQPQKGGKCSSDYSSFAQNIKIEHADGTVAQYVHIKTNLKIGNKVQKGEIIALTDKNGWICYPHLHFGVYSDRKHLYDSTERKTIPLTFEGATDGLAVEGKTYIVP